ncbi:MAG: hypothetical protein WAM46_02815 [Flavobacterium sp.]
MDQLNPLTQFFKAIEKDQHISITPIGIFAALLQFRTAAGYSNSIKASRHEIMKTAKISGPVTCHRCIRDLNDYGYINYLPKRNRNQKSIIYFTL